MSDPTHILTLVLPATCEFCGIALTPKKTAGGWPKRICGKTECDLARRALNARRRHKPTGFPPGKRPAPPEIQKQRLAAARKRYHERHPEKRKEYVARTKDKQLAYSRAYRERNPEKHREAVRRWRKNHPEWTKGRHATRRGYAQRYYEKNREKILAKCRAYRLANKEKKRAQCARYYARKMGAAGTFTAEQFAARAAMFGGKCWIPGCGKPGVEIDHVIAVSKGGSNWPANLRPICRHHNTRKHNRPWRDFLASLARKAA